MSDQELLYTIALTLVLRGHSRSQRALLEALGSASAVYENRKDASSVFEGISTRATEALAGMPSFMKAAEEELAYARAHNIKVLAIQDTDHYPTRLRSCEDAPLILYYLGNADLNADHVVSIVGTRRCTERGRDLCKAMAHDIAQRAAGTLVVSGLAYGIDITAHRAALDNGLPTVAVLAHGLDEIYPSAHRQTAIEMLKQGGLLTEFTTHTPIDRLNFLQRNRIVAGMADATVVVESPARGGSLNTARLATDYHREVFAFPGRPSDVNSEGCNTLIRRNAATLITSASDMMDDLGWTTATKADAQQSLLFADLTADEQRIVDVLAAAETDMALAELSAQLNIPSTKLMPMMVALEMKDVVRTMAGARYHLRVGS